MSNIRSINAESADLKCASSAPWSTESLPDFSYPPLHDPDLDIRLLELLPGRYNDDVRVRIHHAPLVKPQPRHDPRMALKDIRKTLPENWEVVQTLEGRYLFSKHIGEGTNGSELLTSWRHPDPEFDVSHYELPESEHASSSEPKFEALSYCWGSDLKPHFIRIEGDEEDGGTYPARLAITDSLIVALRHLRYASESRTLWIDAVCLDQRNEKEVSYQVSRMGDIYRHAYRVIIWLGPNDFYDERNYVYSSLERIAKEVEYTQDADRSFPAPEAIHKDWYKEGLGNKRDTEFWAVFFNFLRIPWFSRLWVVQEVQLANRIPGPILQWGFDTILSSNFWRAIQRLSDIEGSSTTWITHLLRPLVRSNRRFIFQTISSRTYCKDPRDRVYGLLGLTSGRFADSIKVSYDNKKTTAAVYRDAFLAHTHLTERLELLNRIGQTGRSLVNAPSWLVDWSGHVDFDWSGEVNFDWYKQHGYDRSSRVDFQKQLQDQFSANNSRAHIRYSEHCPDILKVLGIHCAVINRITEPLVERDGALQQVRDWQPGDLGTAKYIPTGESKGIAYAISLIQSEVKERWPGRKDVPSSTEWEDQIRRNPLFGPGSTTPMQELGIDRKLRMALRVCYGRMFFQTDQGHMGLAPRETLQSDIVAIFLGYSNPVVLRPIDGNDNHFRLIGECFVYGLQDSTKLLGPLIHPWRGVVRKFPGERYCLSFENTETGVITQEDPRLEDPDEWERFLPLDDIEQDDPIDLVFFKQRQTGEVIKYDPRLEPDKLRDRGVETTWFTIV